MAQKQTQLFERLGVGDAEDVPNWTRRPQKYAQIIEDIQQLPVGKFVKYRFPSKKAAAQARNTIRDHMNLLVAEAIHEGTKRPIPGIVTTRITPDEDKGGDNVIAYFTMSPSDSVIQAPERESSSGSRKNQPTRRR